MHCTERRAEAINSTTALWYIRQHKHQDTALQEAWYVGKRTAVRTASTTANESLTSCGIGLQSSPVHPYVYQCTLIHPNSAPITPVSKGTFGSGPREPSVTTGVVRGLVLGANAYIARLSSFIRHSKTSTLVFSKVCHATRLASWVSLSNQPRLSQDFDLCIVQTSLLIEQDQQ